MATFTIHAGDWGESEGYYYFGKLSMPGEMLPESQLKSIDIATEETVKKIGGTVGWGVAGGVLLGPVGLLAGLLLGGKKKQITWVAQFKDGRKLLATSNQATYTNLLAAVMNQPPEPPKRKRMVHAPVTYNPSCSKCGHTRQPGEFGPVEECSQCFAPLNRQV